MLVFTPMLIHLYEKNEEVKKDLYFMLSSSTDNTIYWKMKKFHLEPIFKRYNLNYSDPSDKLPVEKLKCFKILVEEACIIKE